jgi:hypothetical protein
MKRAVAGVMHPNTSSASAILNGLSCNLADRIKTCIMLALPNILVYGRRQCARQNTYYLQHSNPSTCKRDLRYLHLFTALVFRPAGWLSGMEVIDESSIQKSYPTRCAIVRGSGSRAVLDCSKVNRVGEADVEAAKKLRRSIRNTLETASEAVSMPACQQWEQC